MSSLTLPLSIVVDVAVQVSGVGLGQIPTFNQGFYMGTSTVIPSAGANARVRNYATTAAMLTDGFITSSPEYIWAQIYFSQSPAPIAVSIGRQDLTAIATATLGGSPGTNYAVNDVVTVVQGGASYGQIKVTSIGSGGSVTGISIIVGSQGTGYAVANNLATTGGSGTGLTIDITAIGETVEQAWAACRTASNSWYLGGAYGASDADIEAVALYCQSSATPTCCSFSSSEAAVLNDTANNLFANLQANGYNRILPIYSTTQGGTYPNNAYSSAVAIGLAMGYNTGLANTSRTLKFRPVTGVAYEPLTLSQVQSIEGLGGNVFANYNNTYVWLEQGTVSNGEYFDQILSIDMLVADMQISIVNELRANGIQLTDSGIQALVGVIQGSCGRSLTRGSLGAGKIWQGQTIAVGGQILTAGTILPNGYMVIADSVNSLTPSQEEARQAPPIYVPIILADSVHSVVIGLAVQL